MSGICQRNGQPAGADSEFENGAGRAVRQGEIQVEIAWVIGQVEVVEAGESRRDGRIVTVGPEGPDDYPSQRTRWPALRRTARALIASSAARFAAMAVVSA